MSTLYGLIQYDHFNGQLDVIETLYPTLQQCKDEAIKLAEEYTDDDFECTVDKSFSETDDDDRECVRVVSDIEGDDDDEPFWVKCTISIICYELNS